jgi:hypothetical protein
MRAHRKKVPGMPVGICHTMEYSTGTAQFHGLQICREATMRLWTNKV